MRNAIAMFTRTIAILGACSRLPCGEHVLLEQVEHSIRGQDQLKLILVVERSNLVELSESGY